MSSFSLEELTQEGFSSPDNDPLGRMMLLDKQTGIFLLANPYGKSQEYYLHAGKDINGRPYDERELNSGRIDYSTMKKVLDFMKNPEKEVIREFERIAQATNEAKYHPDIAEVMQEVEDFYDDIYGSEKASESKSAA